MSSSNGNRSISDVSKGCQLSQPTIDQAQKSGNFTPAFIDYLKETKDSQDARDVVIQRPVIIQYGPQDPFRQLNNKDVTHWIDDIVIKK